MRFVLIRHGQSGNNLIHEQTGGDVGRDPDPRLTDLGHAQARSLAAAVVAGALPWQVTDLYSSLMARAIETAAPLGEALRLPIVGHAELFECGGPHDVHPVTKERSPHPGTPRDDLASLAPGLALPDTAQDWGWWPGPVEDTPAAFAARAARVVSGLRERHDDDAVVALVTHGWFTQYLLRELLGVTSMTGWIDVDNTGVSLLYDEFGQWAGTTSAARINWLPHVDRPGQTLMLTDPSGEPLA
jgi:2,3-bisphosphoglycerate-dependent phosphoglycerate mutase